MNGGMGGTGVHKRQRVLLAPVGDGALLVRFGDRLEEDTNRRAVRAARTLQAAGLGGVLEVSPTLVSVLVRYDPFEVGFMELSGRVRLALDDGGAGGLAEHKSFEIAVRYGGEEGPDLHSVAEQCGLDVSAFIRAHNGARLRVLATGFAPGFVYCGLHEKALHVPRRTSLHARVAPGSILFAAGQTAITATHVPTGWNVIGRTDFRNFTPSEDPPTRLRPGDRISFSGEAQS